MRARPPGDRSGRTVRAARGKARLWRTPHPRAASCAQRLIQCAKHPAMPVDSPRSDACDGRRESSIPVKRRRFKSESAVGSAACGGNIGKLPLCAVAPTGKACQAVIPEAPHGAGRERASGQQPVFARSRNLWPSGRGGPLPLVPISAAAGVLANATNRASRPCIGATASAITDFVHPNPTEVLEF